MLFAKMMWSPSVPTTPITSSKTHCLINAKRSDLVFVTRTLMKPVGSSTTRMIFLFAVSRFSLIIPSTATRSCTGRSAASALASLRSCFHGRSLFHCLPEKFPEKFREKVWGCGGCGWVWGGGGGGGGGGFAGVVFVVVVVAVWVVVMVLVVVVVVRLIG